MSSKIKILKTCEYCGKQFIARTTVTRYCSHECNRKHYKENQRKIKINHVVKNNNKPKESSKPGINQKEFLSINDTSLLLGISERTILRLLKNNRLKAVKFGTRTILRRSDINLLYELQK